MPFDGMECYQISVECFPVMVIAGFCTNSYYQLPATGLSLSSNMTDI